MKGTITLEIPDPTGAIEVTQLHAPRLVNLSGKTICELSNGSWEHARTFPMIRKFLQQRYPDVKIVPYTEFPVGSAGIDVEDIGRMVKEKGGQAVIIGNAA